MCCRVLLAAAERESPAAGLQPGPPQDPVPCQLVVDGVQRQSVPVSGHSSGHLLQDLAVPRLGVGGERLGLGRVVVKVVKQWRVVVRHMFAVAQTDPGVVAAFSPRREEVGGEIVHLEDRGAWKE